MVDSIIFRIHNKLLHENLWHYLDKPDSGIRQMVKMIDDPEPITREVYIQRYFLDAATGRSWKEKHRDFIQSHHYHVSYNMDTDGEGFIEFNFSIPKFLYGNNVMQLVDHLNEPNFVFYRNNDFWNCGKLAFEKLTQSVSRFVARHLGGYFDEKTRTGMVHKSMIEIRRIDLCYNLFFNTQSDCEYYLSQLRGIKRKGIRDTSKQIDYFKGFYSHSKDFTVKVYHKGTEFKKHDYSKVKKRFGEELAESILLTANNIARIEVEYRPGYISEIFRTNLKNTNPYIYKCISMSRSVSKSGYCELRDIKYTLDGLGPPGQNFVKFTPEVKSMVKLGDKLRARDSTFWFRSSEHYSLNKLAPIDALNQYTYKEIFDSKTFALVLENFKNHFMRFQLNDYNALDQLNILLKVKSEQQFKIALAEIGGTLMNVGDYSVRSAKMFLDLLRDNTWDEIRAKGVVSDRMFYRYKKLFKNLGIHGQKITEYDFKVKFDYSNYFNQIHEWYWKVRLPAPID